jgi:RNA polymerase sigma factor (sigma-70 family)
MYPEKVIEGNEGVAPGSGKHSPEQMMPLLAHCLPCALYRCAYRLLGNKADAEDAVQDALLAACKHLNQFRGDAQLSTWLTAIVINCARMQLRKRSRHAHLSLDSRIGEEQRYWLSDILVDEKPNPEDECHNSRLNARLMKSAGRLSPTLRRAFHLRYVDNLSLCEIAAALGIPIGTVKVRLARARTTLLKSMRRVLSRGPAERASCPPTGQNQNNAAASAIKREAASFMPSQRRILAGS